jgi:chorismate-pyruvate lyase
VTCSPLNRSEEQLERGDVALGAGLPRDSDPQRRDSTGARYLDLRSSSREHRREIPVVRGSFLGNRRTAAWCITDGSRTRRRNHRSRRANVYLTDEVFLYRVIGVVASADGELVELEDCMYLDVVRVPLADVRARRLRVVTPA